MADRYWVGGTGTWIAGGTSKWSATNGGASGASVPTAADDVFITSLSGSPTITLSGALTCKSITTTGATCTFTSTGTITVSGGITLSATTTWSATGTTTINASSTITTNGVSLSCSITYNAIGGTVQLGSALTLVPGRVFTFTNGTLTLNNFTLSCGTFTSNNTNVRTINFGTGNITTVSGLNQIVNGSNLTVTGTPVINLTGTAGINLSVPNFTDTNCISYNVTSSGSLVGVNLNKFKSLNLSGFTGTYSLSNTQTFFGDLTFSSAMTFTPGTIALSFENVSNTATFTSAGKTVYAINKSGSNFLTISGALTVSNAFTFSEGRLQLPAGATTSIGTFTTSGTSLKYLTSTISGTQATISSATNATVTYLYIKDSNATGGAVWTATDPTNVNGGNNTGWSLVPVVYSGKFLLAF